MEEERKRREDEDYCKVIEYQFKKDICTPLEEFIDAFNKQYPQGEIAISALNRGTRSNEVGATITLISRRKIEVRLRPILEKECFREVTSYDFGERYTRTELQIPTYRGRRIRAWGGLFIDKMGFNILLMENEGELYGEWIILENTNSGLVSSNRPQPFAFEFNEIEKGIQQIGVMGRYNSKIEEFNIEKFMIYISMYNM